MTAANKELPFGTKLSVQNLTNGRSCVVVINDRGPYVRGRGIDLSREAAKRIGMAGTAPVYCCSVDTSPSTAPTPSIAPAPSPTPTPSVAPTPSPAPAPSTALTASIAMSHHRGMLHASKSVHSFQYVAYLGAKRVHFDGFHSANKFVKNYRA